MAKKNGFKKTLLGLLLLIGLIFLFTGANIGVRELQVPFWALMIAGLLIVWFAARSLKPILKKK